MLATWAAILLLCLLALAPLAWSLRHRTVLRDRRDAALDLHRAQLAEIDRDRDDGRIGLPEHQIARLEVQRRLLAEAETAAPPGTRGSALPLLAAMALLPVAAILLYLPGARPRLPAEPLAARRAAAAAQTAQAATLATELQARIASLPAGSDRAREGWLLLGNLRDTGGDLAAAADAWSRALAIRFDATLAAQIAEARSRLDGHVGPAAAALFRQALAAAPADAPWRPIAEQRLAEAAATPPGSPAAPPAPLTPAPTPPSPTPPTP